MREYDRRDTSLRGNKFRILRVHFTALAKEEEQDLSDCLEIRVQMLAPEIMQVTASWG